jgi:hypothetical protein
MLDDIEPHSRTGDEGVVHCVSFWSSVSEPSQTTGLCRCEASPCCASAPHPFTGSRGGARATQRLPNAIKWAGCYRVSGSRQLIDLWRKDPESSRRSERAPGRGIRASEASAVTGGGSNLCPTSRVESLGQARPCRRAHTEYVVLHAALIVKPPKFCPTSAKRLTFASGVRQQLGPVTTARDIHPPPSTEKPPGN